MVVRGAGGRRLRQADGSDALTRGALNPRRLDRARTGTARLRVGLVVGDRSRSARHTSSRLALRVDDQIELAGRKPSAKLLRRADV